MEWIRGMPPCALPSSPPSGPWCAPPFPSLLPLVRPQPAPKGPHRSCQAPRYHRTSRPGPHSPAPHTPCTPDACCACLPSPSAPVPRGEGAPMPEGTLLVWRCMGACRTALCLGGGRLWELWGKEGEGVSGQRGDCD